MSKLSSDNHLCQIAIPIPAGRGTMMCYDYHAGPAKDYPPGTIVSIPLGRREVWGILIAHHQTATIAHDRLKWVTCLADAPSLTADNLRFLKQVSRWTLAPFGAVMKQMLNTPEALIPLTLYKHYSLNPNRPTEIKLTPQRRRIISFLADLPPLAAADIARQTALSVGVITAMEKAGLLIAIMQPRSTGFSQFTPKMMTDRHHQLTLSTTQKTIADNIRLAGDSQFNIHLLDGITGSGKTEVYFDLVARIGGRGQQALILLPEIALTKSWQDRFHKWFGFKPAIWHSSISPARRRDIWRRAIEGAPMIVAGARSALFLPLANLGLVIVDEEHDSSYKQEDYVAYQARDMAILRAKLANVPVILASATPSLESWVNAGGQSAPAPTSEHSPQKGESLFNHHCAQPHWHHHLLPNRYGGAHLPEITVVDMRKSRPGHGKWISSDLITQIAARLEAKEQSLLFLNRRGYAPMTVCEECGHRLACHQCDALLVTHRLSGRVQCHFCGIGQPLIESCVHCEKSGGLRLVGPGVERLEEEIRLMFPEARIAILSSDLIRTTTDADNFFAAVENADIDIIIGTQMAAKGHHFPLLTLVGVIDADLGLGGGDLRAAERTYQLLCQVAGRSGRSHRPGQVIIQTVQPRHPVIEALFQTIADDPFAARNAFMNSEALARKAASMPPFGRLAALILSSSDLQQLEMASAALSKTRPDFAKVNIYGPAPAPLSRIRGEFRMRYLIRTDKDVALQKIIADWLNTVKTSPKVRIICDIDPYNFL